MTNLADRMTDSVIIEEEKSEAITQIAIIDKLTGLYLRSIFDISLDKLVKISLRYQDSLSLVMLDIDDFKKVNDTYGHQKGDEVLTRVGIMIDKNIRDSDLAARYGGEEMAIILPRTDDDLAKDVAERIRLDIFDEFKDDTGVTISLGVSSINNAVTSLKS
jgi:diguanylate cyclase (GGDEF)-like protein